MRSGGQTRGQLLDACRSTCPQHTRAVPFLPSLPVSLSIIQQACLSRGPMWVGVLLPRRHPFEARDQQSINSSSEVALLSPGLPLVTSPGTTARGSCSLFGVNAPSRTCFPKMLSDPVVLGLETSKTKQNFSSSTAPALVFEGKAKPTPLSGGRGPSQR